MKGTFHSNTIRVTVLYSILAIYFCVICFLNFSSVPSFYDSDMYCDYRYAMEAWTHKSIFPEGWVFGNQLNAVSTPVLAALIYGVSQNMNFSMAAACVIMAVLVMVCYDWMIRDILKDMESRLVACVLFVTVSLYCGRAVHGNLGWTLFFTMCSYYAGYSITAFLAFGCYLRGLSGNFKYQCFVIAITCILSFGTGIQSIRQTAIMVAPILAAEFLRLVGSFRSWKQNRNPLWIAAGITVSNFLGLLYVRMREVNQNQIFGKIELTALSDLKQVLVDTFAINKDLLALDHLEALIVFAGLCVASLGSLILILQHVRRKKNIGILLPVILMGISVLIIVAIDVFTTMYVRPRYYFMLYPLMSFLIAYLYENCSPKFDWLLLICIFILFSLACMHNLPDVTMDARRHREEECYEISAYLLENGYTTVYAEWNRGHDVAIASNGKIDAGYWYVEERPFEKVTHLCSMDIYDREAARCVYLFVGDNDAEIGVSVAEAVGIEMKLIRHYPKSNTYLYTAPVNLMQAILW